MRPILAATLFLLTASPSAAQIKAKPTYRVGEPIVAEAALIASGEDAACSWLADSEGCELREVDGGKLAHVWAVPGKHKLFLAVATFTDGRPSIQLHRAFFEVVDGDPVPPDPVPPEPDPVPPEPESGPRVVLIVHETTDDAPWLKSLMVKLRSGIEADYLASKGHLAVFLDDDLTDGDQNKAELLHRYADAVTEDKLPALLIIDRSTEKLITSERLAPGTTAANITEAIRQTGG